MQRWPRLCGQASRLRLSGHCDGGEARGFARGLALKVEGPLAEVNIRAFSQCLKERHGMCGVVVTAILRSWPLLS